MIAAMLKGWTTALLAVAAFGGSIFALIWATAPSPDQRIVAVVAICRDGSRIYQRANGNHYSGDGIAVPHPETACK